MDWLGVGAMWGTIKEIEEKNKPMYASYRCSYRRITSSKVCDNKEIRKEYIEEYVLSG